MKIGLVLSGGGAKGAYQIGVFEALNQLDLLGSVGAVSGCSIGALNALLLTGSDPRAWSAIWGSLSYESLMMREAAAPGITEGGVTAKLSDFMAALRAKEHQIKNLPHLLAQGELSPFSLTGIHQALSQKMDFDRMRRSGTELWSCAYNLEEEKPEYFQLSDLPNADIVTLAMASAAIPVVFPPVEYKGRHYCDGGIVPPYSKKKNADKIPVTPLQAAGCDLVVVVYLSHHDKVTLDGFPAGTQLLELYPSSPLEMIRGAGTLKLSKDTLAEHMLMGKHDALAAFAPLMLELERGGTGQKSLQSHQDYNKQLLEEKLPLLRRAEEAIKR